MPFRTPQTKYVTLAEDVANSVTFTGEQLCLITVVSVGVAGPVYFRADGFTADVEADGTFMLVGIGGYTEISIPASTSVTVSLISEFPGDVEIVAEEAP